MIWSTKRLLSRKEVKVIKTIKMKRPLVQLSPKRLKRHQIKRLLEKELRSSQQVRRLLGKVERPRNQRKSQ